VRSDAMPGLQNSSEQTPEGSMTGYVKQLEKWLCATKNQAVVRSCYMLENETNYSDILIIITPELVSINQSSESFDMYPKFFVPPTSHPT